MLGKKFLFIYLFSLLSAVVLADDGGENSAENIVQTTAATDDGDTEGLFPNNIIWLFS